MAEGEAWRDVLLVERAIVDIEAFRERILNLEEFEANQADGGRVIGFCFGNGIRKMPTRRVIAEEDVCKRIACFLPRQVRKDNGFHGWKVYPFLD